MLNEHKSRGKARFCITTVSQKYCSEDLLFPYDRYLPEVLFPNGDDRTQFEKICLHNLSILQKSINSIIDILNLDSLRIFISAGYDTRFNTIHCSVDQMIQRIYLEVIESFILDSTIFILNKQVSENEHE